MAKIGIIAGSGVDDLLFTQGFRSRKIKTSYGSIDVKEGKIGGKAVVFLNRHGRDYCAPHEINFLSNIQALKRAGVNKIIATAAVGSLNLKMKPGDFVLLSDFIDFTRQRTEFFDASRFSDLSCPYDEDLRQVLLRAARTAKAVVHPSSVYICVEGPRFETRAEIKMFGRLGGDVVGMTQVPEVVLAVEANIPYAVIGVVTNYAAGISPAKITSAEVIEMMSRRAKVLSDILLETVKSR